MDIEITELMPLFVLIAVVIYYIIHMRCARAMYENKLIYSYPDIISCDDNFRNNFISEIKEYEATNDMVNEVEEKIRMLPFPIPSEPNDSETSVNIISKLGALINEHSEQIEEFANIILETTARHYLKTAIRGSLETIFAEKTSRHNIETTLEIETFDLGDTSIDIMNIESVGEGGDILGDAEGSSLEETAFKMAINVSVWASKEVYKMIKYRKLNSAIKEYRSASKQIAKDSKLLATQSVNAVRSVAINKRSKFLENLSAAPRFDNSKSDIVAITQRLINSFRKDIYDYNRQLKKLKNSKFASVLTYKEIIDGMDLKINEMKKEIPFEDKINNEPIESLCKIINIRFMKDKIFHNDLSTSFQKLKYLVENHQAAMLAWTTSANAAYEQVIYDIGFELSTQIQNYNKKSSEWREILIQKKELVDSEKRKL
jgi:hypothetical protein